MRKIYLLVVLLFTGSLVWAQTPEMIQKIRQEGLENSKVMDIAFQLTEVSGPRLMASPGFYKAADYAVKQLKDWGLENSKLDPWGDFGKGWELEKSYIAMKSPWYKPLIAFPKAWTKGTNGFKNAEVILISAKDSAEFVEKYKGKLAGKVIIKDDLIRYTLKEKADLVRYTQAELDSMQAVQLTPPDTAAMRRRFGNFNMEAFRRTRALAATINKMADEEGAIALLSSSAKNHDGTVFVQGGGAYRLNSPENFLDIALALEDYNMIVRLLRADKPVNLELEVATKFHTDVEKGYNVIAEIPGTDILLKNEVVMVGAHLDSWQGSTGATDNAAGSAVMMEAMRILKSLDIDFKRTIRIALWSGEEQGIHGSRGYVTKTFADRADMKVTPAHGKFNVYFNLDNGTGRIRGIYLQENEAARNILTEWMAPFKDLGATTVTVSNTGGTDHLSFDGVGLPGFQFIQDEVEYGSRTHHSNMDSYDHLVADDLKQAATIIAGMVYQAAMTEQKVPRKPLPKPVPPGRGFF